MTNETHIPQSAQRLLPLLTPSQDFLRFLPEAPFLLYPKIAFKAVYDFKVFGSLSEYITVFGDLSVVNAYNADGVCIMHTV